MPNNIDPRKVGVSGLKGLNRLTPATREEEYQSIMNTPKYSARSLSLRYMPDPQKPVGLEMGNLGYGESQYDENAYDAASFREDANEIRALNQGSFATIGNGLMRGVGTFATSLVDTTAGFLTGLGYAARDWFNGAGFLEGLGEIGRNPVSQSMSGFNDKMREWFPTYRTSEEQNGNWLANIFTHPVNFFSDQLENVGFMAAGALTGKIGVGIASKLLDGITSSGKLGWLASAKKVRTAFDDINTIAAENGTSVGNVVKAIKSAEAGDKTLLGKLLGGEADISENFISDLHAKAKMAKRLNMGMQMVGSIGGAIGEGTFQAATDSRDFEKYQTERMLAALPKIELQERQKLFSQNPELFTMATNPETGQSQLVPTQKGQQVLSQRMAQIKDNMQKQIEVNSKKMSAVDFLGNLPILTATDLVSLGRYYVSGFRTARNGAARELRKAALSEGMAEPAESIRPLSSNIKKRVTGSALDGTLQYHKRSALEKAVNALAAPVAEGNEELAQQAVTTGSGYAYDDNPDDLYHARHSSGYGHILSNMWKGTMETYGDYDQWQQFAAAFISTAVGIPVLKHGHIGLAAGIAGSLAEQNREDARNAELTELGAKAGQNIKERMSQYIAGKVFDDGKDIALHRGDEKKYRDYDDSAMISDVLSVARTGRTAELMDLIEPYVNLTGNDRDAIQNIYNATSKAAKVNEAFDLEEGSVPDSNVKQAVEDGTPDVNTIFPENFDINNENDRNEIAETISKRAKKLQKTISEAHKISSDLLERTGDVFTDEDLDYLTWTAMKADKWKDRIGETFDNIKSYLHSSPINITYIGTDGNEHYLSDTLDKMTSQQFADEIYISAIAEKHKENIKEGVKAPNLIKVLGDSNMEDIMKNLTPGAENVAQDIEDIVHMTYDRAKFIRMYNDYISHPELLRARNEKIREAELAKLEGIHKDSLVKELSQVDNLEDFNNILNNSEHAVSSRVTDSALQQVADKGGPSGEIAQSIIESRNHQSNLAKVADWIRGKRDKKDKQNNNDLETEEVTPPSEDNGLDIIEDEALADEIENNLSEAAKNYDAVDRGNPEAEPADNTQKSEPLLPPEEPEEESAPEEKALLKSDPQSNEQSQKQIAAIGDNDSSIIKENKENDEAQKKIPEFNYINGVADKWKSMFSEFEVEEMNRDEYIPFDVKNPQYREIAKFLKENTDAMNLEGNLLPSDKILFRITPSYKNSEGYNDTANHHKVTDRKSYTVFMVNSRTGRIVGVLASYAQAGRKGSTQLGLQGFLESLFDSYNKYLDSPEFDRNKDWDFHTSEETEVLDRSSIKDTSIPVVVKGNRTIEGKYTVSNDSDGYTRINLTTSDGSAMRVSDKDLGLSVDDIVGNESTFQSKESYEEVKKEIEDGELAIKNITIRPNGSIEIVANQVDLTQKAARVILEKYFGAKFEKTGKKNTLIEASIDGLVSGRVKYANQELARSERNRSLSSLVSDYNERKGPNTPELKIGVMTRDGMCTEEGTFVPISNNIDRRDKSYHGRVYLLIPRLDGKYSAVHLDKHQFSMSAYNEMKGTAGTLYSEIKDIMHDFNGELGKMLSSGVDGVMAVQNNPELFKSVITEFRDRLQRYLYLGSNLEVYLNVDNNGRVFLKFENKELEEANRGRNINVSIPVAEPGKDGLYPISNDEDYILKQLADYMGRVKNGLPLNVSLDSLGEADYTNMLLKTNFLFAGIQDARMAAPFFTLKPVGNIVEKTQEKVAETVQSAVESPVENTSLGVKKKGHNSRVKTRLKKSDAGYTVWNRQKEMEWLGKALPQLTLADRLSFVDGLIKIHGVTAYGYFKTNMIVLSNVAEEGTLYHEAFHYVFNALLQPGEQEALYNEARGLYGNNLSEIELEERLAEDFRKYVMTGILPDVKKENTVIKAIKRFFKSLFTKTWVMKTNPTLLDTYFRNISKGTYANAVEREPDEEVLRLQKNTEEEENILENAKRDSKGRLLAPNGKPSNLTERQYVQVRTKAFKDWFGDWENDKEHSSKAIDENGEPMVLYHGSSFAGFSSFDNSTVRSTISGGNNIGHSFFTSDLNAALRYARLPVQDSSKNGVEHEHTTPGNIWEKIMDKLGKFTPMVIPNSERIPEGARMKTYTDTSNLTTDEKRDELFKGNSRSAVYAVFLNVRNPLDIDYKGKPWSESPVNLGSTYYITYSIDGVNTRKEFESREAMDKFVDGFIKEHKLYEDTVNYTRGVKDGAYNGAQLNKSATGYDKGTGVTYNIFEYTKPYPNTTNGVTMYATKKGYDSTIQRNVLDAAVKENNYPITDFTISNPSQVKSATDNVGTFDSNNEDIRRRRANLWGEKNKEEEDEILGNAKRDSNGRLLAPNNKISNLTERQYVQVRTKAFKKWFGDWENTPDNASKIVDENGEPLVVYHGSKDEFYIFDKSYLASTTGKVVYKDPVTGEEIESDSSHYFFFTNSKTAAYSYRNLAQYKEKEQRLVYYKNIKAILTNNDYLFTKLEGEEKQKQKDFIDNVLSPLLGYNLRYALNNNTLSEGQKKSLLGKLDTVIEKLHKVRNEADARSISNQRNSIESWTKDLNYLKEHRQDILDGKNFADRNFSFVSGYGNKSDGDYSAYISFFDNHWRFNGTVIDNSNIDTAFNEARNAVDKTMSDLQNTEKEYNYRGEVMGVFLNMRNPLTHDYEGSPFPDKYKKNQKYPTAYVAARQAKKALRDGNDGVIYENIVDPFDMTSYGVSESNQIKSATGNIGTYDENNNDIRYRRTNLWEDQPIGTEKVGNDYKRYRGNDQASSNAEYQLYEGFEQSARLMTGMRTNKATAEAFYARVRKAVPNASISIVRRSNSNFWNIAFRKMSEPINKNVMKLDNWNEISTFDSLPKDLQDTYLDLGIGPNDYNWLPTGLKDTMAKCS